MFKITIPIQKAARNEKGKLIVEGIASDPAIDRDEERFAPEALEKMVDCVNKGGIKVRAEHQDRFYTNIGEWTEAKMLDGYKMYVKGEIDTDLSLGKDIEVLLNKGIELSLSVGGKVIDACYEYVKELGKNIKTYKDVVLEEISVLTRPSNYNTSLQMSKTLDWSRVNEFSKSESGDKVPYSTEATKLISIYKSMKYTSPKELSQKVKKNSDENILKYTRYMDDKKKKMTPEDKKKQAKMKKWVDDLGAKISPLFGKMEYSLTPPVNVPMGEVSCCDDGECEMCYERPYVMTPDDYLVVAKLTTIMNEVELPSQEEVWALWDDKDYQMVMETVGEDAFIIMSDRSLQYPHHNADYTVNKDWLLIQLKRLIDNGSWMRPKDYNIALNHLYKHLKEFSMVKSAKQDNKVEMVDKSQKVFGEMTVGDIELLQKCHAYKTSTGEMPDNGAQKMTEEEVSKGAIVYSKLLNDQNFISLIQKLMTVKKEETTPTNPQVEPEVTKPAEEAETVVAADPAKPEGEQPVEVTPPVETPAAPAEEQKPEVTPVVEEPKPEAPVVEEKKEEVTPTEQPVEQKGAEQELKDFEKMEQSLLKKVSDLLTKPVQEVAKSVAKVTTVLDGVVEKQAKFEDVTKEVKTLSETIEKMAKIVDILAKAPLGRKSQAVSFKIMEKTFSGSNDAPVDGSPQALLDAAVAKEMAADKTLPWAEAYRRAKVSLSQE